MSEGADARPSRQNTTSLLYTSLRLLRRARAGDREVVLGPGGYITKPRGELHTMWNAGPEPARMIEVISPAGFEHFFREMADLTAAGPPQLPEIIALADRYGLQFGQPDWLPDLIARYHLTPPPGV